MMTHDPPFRGVAVVTDVTDVSRVAKSTETSEETPGPRVRRPEWVAHVLDDAVTPPRAVLLHLPSGRRTGLSDTATRVWRAIVDSGADGVTAKRVADLLAPEYGVLPGAILGDIADLYGDLLEGEWVEVVAQGGPA